MKTAGFPKAVNATQAQFLSLCALGGGPKGGPARPKVQHLLRESGKKLNEFAYEQIGAQMVTLAGRNPWHICFAVGMSWGHLARLDVTFTEAAVNLIEDWNDAHTQDCAHIPLRAWAYPDRTDAARRSRIVLQSDATTPSSRRD